MSRPNLIASDTVRVSPHPYAGPYNSTFLQLNPDLQGLFAHLNCSFLSTRGKAPTLLELKQHAQALLVLIKHLTVAADATLVDDPTGPVAIALAAARHTAEEANKDIAEQRAADAAQGRVRANLAATPAQVASIRARAFDFLSDLSVSYDNSDPTHNTTLTGVLNTLEDRGSVDRRGRDHCPLHAAAVVANPATRGTQALPYAETWKLIKHANELLERLDHEFSAEGGLLGMLPLDAAGHDMSKADDLLGARSVLGQWISMTRKLIVRHHELEQNLSEALNIIQGDAVVPKYLLSKIPINARQETTGVFAHQDEIVVTLADGKLNELRAKFAAAEATAFDSTQHALGSGEGNQDIITITAETTYARLRQGNTIFIAPGQVNDTAKRPGVIQVVKGEWPARTSLWEQKHYADLNKYKSVAEVDLPRIQVESEGRRVALEALVQERDLFLLAGGKLPTSVAEKAALKEMLFGPEIAAEKARLKHEEEKLKAQVAKLKDDRETLYRERAEFDARQARTAFSDGMF